MSLPKENLDNKTFDELVKEAVTRIPVYAPEWTDHNAHDPGITFIELFSWLVEMQLYRLNRITDENYRKFLKLIGIIQQGNETLEEAIYRARVELKEITRAVTSQDYEYLALKTPGIEVARAKCLPRYHPSHEDEVPGIVSVIIVPKNLAPKPMPVADFVKTVYKHLDEHRLLTTELFVIPPEYVEVSVKATVVIKPKYLKETVKEKVNIELKKFLNPITGGIDGKGWPFGRHVYISEIYEIIDGVEGVDYVRGVELFKVVNNENKKVNGDIIIPPHFLVCSVEEHNITAVE